jgi:hypothetical protein
LFFILIKLPNFLSDIHLGIAIKIRNGFSKANANCGLNLYKSEFIQNLCFILVSILVLAKAIFIAFMAFLPHYSQMILK